tara:strand:- start:1000 stop:1149 length:150 start_codon:yes stop_codon:yes gene_type:complete
MKKEKTYLVRVNEKSKKLLDNISDTHGLLQTKVLELALNELEGKELIIK